MNHEVAHAHKDVDVGVGAEKVRPAAAELLTLAGLVGAVQGRWSPGVLQAPREI